eukprot:TRINITY_DN8118_c0_g1_i1.p1 TRINITY_DN8118_c0_g1~~TRINITY_DN8118_c0_g1_i1.p1  ORF type:complete len:241 (+),score=50.54 TRINITY_DN8118_c0_g1_i1:9-731(+)
MSTELKVNVSKPDGSSVPVYLFNSENAASQPSVIVIQEWWGINDTIKKHAQHIADNGFTVLVPDLYRGKLGLNAEEAHHLMSNLDFQVAIKDIEACANYLREKSQGRKVGVTGFCMGGALTLAVANQTKSVDASAPFYGIPQGGPVKNITIPVQAHFGEEDSHKGFSDLESAKKLEEQLKSINVPDLEFYYYPKQGHAFMNGDQWSNQRKIEMGAPAYDHEVAKLAWSRLFSFFSKHLQK